MAQKKSAKKRGSRTHGYGAGKKHRGAGNRGGRGRAGRGKRGQQKLTSYHAKGIQTLRKRKKHPHIKKKIRTITLEQLAVNLEKWLSAKKIKKNKDLFIINLTELGYDKLLGTGLFKEKVEVTVSRATEKARKKIESFKGKLNTNQEDAQ